MDNGEEKREQIVSRIAEGGKKVQREPKGLLGTTRWLNFSLEGDGKVRDNEFEDDVTTTCNSYVGQSMAPSKDEARTRGTEEGPSPVS